MGPVVQGTSLARVIIDTEAAIKNDPRARGKGNGESVIMWCLSLGPMLRPKAFFYSMTVQGVIIKAEEALKERMKAVRVKENQHGN